MKALRIAIVTLVRLMAAGLANSAYLTARCRDWTARLDAVTAAAESGDQVCARQAVAGGAFENASECFKRFETFSVRKNRFTCRKTGLFKTVFYGFTV